MEAKEVLEGVESSKEYTDWKAGHRTSFLAHIFCSPKEGMEENDSDWQVGYFIPETRSVTAFIKKNGSIILAEGLEVLKPDEVMPLDRVQLIIGTEKALEAAAKARAEAYGTEPVLKTFFMIHAGQEGAVYSITYFTQSFKTINLKVSASDGRVIEQSEKDLIRRL